jgi:hypothetical protein
MAVWEVIFGGSEDLEDLWYESAFRRKHGPLYILAINSKYVLF